MAAFQEEAALPPPPPPAVASARRLADLAPVASSRLVDLTAEGLRLAAARVAEEPRPPAAPVPTPTAALCDSSQSPLYCVYTVESGDTLSKIATKFGLKSTEDLAGWDLLVFSNRPDIITAQDYIQPGQKLRIPVETGVIHLVLGGESVSEIARRYGVSVADIVGASGPVSDQQTLQVGQELLVRSPRRLAGPATSAAPPPIASAAGQAAGTPTPETAASPRTSPTAPGTPATTGTALAQPSATRKPVTSSTAPTRRTGFIWPTTGPISSYFGPSHPLGIDIDLFQNTNAPIVAAAAGTVTFAGGNPCCSYGLYVVIDHGNGYVTLYAHLSRILVRTGQKVNQGELLGYSGMTGYATGPHLHFEVHYKDTIIDPLSILP